MAARDAVGLEVEREEPQLVSLLLPLAVEREEPPVGEQALVPASVSELSKQGPCGADEPVQPGAEHPLREGVSRFPRDASTRPPLAPLFV